MATQNRWRSDLPLVIQISRELSEAEKLLYDLENDSSLRQRFAEKPLNVLIERGLVPTNGETDASISRANRILLALITNKPLVSWFQQNLPMPSQEVINLLRESYTSPGPLEIPDEYVAQVVAYATTNAKFLDELLTHTLTQCEFRALLPNNVSTEELREFLFGLPLKRWVRR